ncbi:MAG: UPF0182 family protein [Firmicutes bacterium]|nr:UPF0182 family protein [Bacillota bacterium]
MPERRRWPVIGLVVLILVFFLLTRGSHFYTDWLWFQSLHYQQVFLKILLTGLGLKIAGTALFFLFLLVNLLFTRPYLTKMRYTPADTQTIEPNAWPQMIGPRLINIAFVLGSVIAALVFSSAFSGKWLVFQQYLHPISFGKADPLFGKDISFYFFTLPFYLFLYRLAFGAVLFTTLMVALVYFGMDPLKGRSFWRSKQALTHLSFLSAGLFALKAWGYYLNQFLLLYSERGTVFGPGYTDVHASLLAIRVLIVLALAAAFFGIYGGVRSSLKYPLYAVGALFCVSFVLGVLYPAVVQKVLVEPNELERERPYIQHAINYTRSAYNLGGIERKRFPAGKTLQESDVRENQDAFANIRLWDWKPLKETYSQMQEIRSYYQFTDIDIDRYTVNGQYRQVMLGARELIQEELPAQAKTWINRHLKYTHGYGIAMSPVNEVTSEGLPEFFFKDIPPQTRTDLRINRPEIYFGEARAPYVVVNTKTGEFDYPKGDQNVYTRYRGNGGVPVGSFWRRLAFAFSFGDYRLLLSTDITRDSRILYYRNIEERVKKIAPFLSYDRDPYIVIADGKMFFLWDAYTTSRWYPYSEPYRDFNYIRNAVKVVVDAYDGTVSFFLSDPDDPVIRSMARIFPGLFKPLGEMSRELSQHLRYPEDLFTIQAQMYAVYHMQDPQVYYNKEDKWVLPTEMFGDEEVQVEPYYIITRLPGQNKPEFMLILPFTPQNKKNMIAWLAARCDGEDYGKLLVYEFPKQELVFGPMQVEARIDQDAQISAQLTLWDQRGSRVIRGNLLVIPVKDALLYVEPLYLQAEQSKMPELRRVIVVHGDRIVMEPSLETAVEKVFAGRTAVKRKPEEGIPKRTVKDLAREARRLFERAEESLRSGDWKGYGDNLEQLKRTLEALDKEA